MKHAFALESATKTGTILGLVALMTWSSMAWSSVPTTTWFEGALTSKGGGPVTDGIYKLSFALYTASKGGSTAWNEGPIEIQVVGGRFALQLGKTQPMNAAVLAKLPGAWIGVKVAAEPELPRVQVGSAPYALVAAAAGSLACSGCVGVGQLKFDGDVDLGANSLKAKNGTFTGDIVAASVTATKFAGDGSALTGIKIPTGTCSQEGQVVKGIKADGSLQCVSFTGTLPKDGISALSNGALSNVFNDQFTAPAKGLAIPDNAGTAATSNITVPDIGNVRELAVSAKISNTDLSKVSIQVLPPNDKAKGWVMCDPCGKQNAKSLDVKWDKTNKPKSADLASWEGKNAKGLWTLKVLDTAFCIPQIAGNAALCDVNKKTDGKLLDWSVEIETLSNQKVHGPNGDVIARIASAQDEALADTKSLTVDTKSTSAALIAQAWVYDKDNKRWLPASTAVDGVGGCNSCGDGKDGKYAPQSSTSLAGKTYNFTDFVIPKGVTINVTGNLPLIIKVIGKFEVAGVLDLSGKAAQSPTPNQYGCSGNSGCASGGAGGPGGSTGAQGCYGQSGKNGNGVGGGKAGNSSGYGSGGGGGGYGTSGATAQSGSSGQTPGAGGSTYAGVHAGVLVGGSGGGSGGYGSAYNSGGGGGGGGGGALRIDASTVTISGTVRANGGAGGRVRNNCDGGGGGGGSGGGIWLRASKVDLSGGTIQALGGKLGDTYDGGSDGGDGGKGGDGQVRIDSSAPVTGSTSPAFKAGDASDLGTVLNRFVMEQVSDGVVKLTNTSGQTHRVKLVVSY